MRDYLVVQLCGSHVGEACESKWSYVLEMHDVDFTASLHTSRCSVRYFHKLVSISFLY